MKRASTVFRALKLSLWTAFWVFAGLTAPFAFSPIQTEQKVARIYQFAGQMAAISASIVFVGALIHSSRRNR